jgi:hypothetical protein
MIRACCVCASLCLVLSCSVSDATAGSWWKGPRGMDIDRELETERQNSSMGRLNNNRDGGAREMGGYKQKLLREVQRWKYRETLIQEALKAQQMEAELELIKRGSVKKAVDDLKKNQSLPKKDPNKTPFGRL